MARLANNLAESYCLVVAWWSRLTAVIMSASGCPRI